MRFGQEMASKSSEYIEGGAGYQSKEEIAHNILKAERIAADRMNIHEERPEPQNFYQPQVVNNYPVQQPVYQQPVYQQPQQPVYQPPMQVDMGVMPAYPITPPQRTNFTTEEDMENIDISKYIGKPKEGHQPNGDIGVLVKEIRETNKRLEAMCKILGLIYQQNMQNHPKQVETLQELEDDINNGRRTFVRKQRKQEEPVEEPEMSVAEETEMLNNLPLPPAIDPLAEDDEDEAEQ